MSRARIVTTLASATVVLAAGSSTRAAPDVGTPAVVAIVGRMSPAGALAAAREEMGARWRLEIVQPAAASSATAPGAVVEDLVRAYLDADFLLCLAELQRRSLDPDDLLARGLRAEAAQVATLGAACALGAGDERQARDMVRRLVARELDAPDVLLRTTPDFQHLVESEQRAALAHARVTVQIDTRPPGGSVEVDGRSACASAPCRMRLVPGEHVVRAGGIGLRPRTLNTAFERDSSVQMALEAASGDEAARQLQRLLASGRDPSGIEVMQAVSTAFGAGLAVLVWRRGAEVHASVYQRSSSRLVHMALEAAEPDAAAQAVRAALHEWRRGDVCVDAVRSSVEPPPLVGGAGHAAAAPSPAARAVRRTRYIWAAAVGAVLVGSVALFLATYAPPSPNRGVSF